MSIFDAYCRLEGLLDGSISCDESLARHTTYRIGGPAALYVDCASVSDLSLTCDILAEEEVPWTVIGRGSNLLVADEGYDGAVIVLSHEFSHYRFSDEDVVEGEETPEGGEVLVTSGSAVILSHLVQKAFGRGLSGFEFAVGIPGTLGGALFMNAGSKDAWIGSIVDTVTTYVPGSGLRCRRGSEIAWGYRRSGIPSGEIIVEATLRTHTADPMMLRAQMEASLKRRKGTQPFNLPSCGSVFRNPEGDSAGRLIESLGLKGLICGGARISEKHANFIVNEGSASAADVLELIHIARNRVKEAYGIELRPEVRFLGFPE